MLDAHNLWPFCTIAQQKEKLQKKRLASFIPNFKRKGRGWRVVTDAASLMEPRKTQGEHPIQAGVPSLAWLLFKTFFFVLAMEHEVLCVLSTPYPWSIPRWMEAMERVAGSPDELRSLEQDGHRVPFNCPRDIRDQMEGQEGF
jgi:hypothetical protein